MRKETMGKLFQSSVLAFLMLCGGVSLAVAQEQKAEEKKQSQVKMPRQPLPGDALITLDFQDADLNVVIKFMGELTGRNILVSDQVKGKVTIISPKRITVREAFKVFESVLDMNGYVAIPAEDAVKIVPSGLARQQGRRSAGRRSGRGRRRRNHLQIGHAGGDHVQREVDGVHWEAVGHLRRQHQGRD